MKRTRFSGEQIVAALKQPEVGIPVAELIRKVRISQQTFYRWKKQLQDENVRLEWLAADLTLDRVRLLDVLGREF